MTDVVSYLLIDGFEVELIRKSKKTLTLYVLPPDGKLRVTAPLRASQKIIREFISQRQAWIRKVRLKLRDQPLQPEFSYISGELHPLWGREYRLTVLPAGGKAHVGMAGNELLLFISGNATVEKRAGIMAEFYRAQVRAQVPLLLDAWQKRIGVEASGWQVKNLRRRWGSCVAAGKKINLSLRLAVKPLPCLEYVIAHELCHLRIPNHSPAFYELLEQVMPDWRERKSILKNRDFKTR
jgi:predicted metal-dependent hydrolase